MSCNVKLCKGTMLTVYIQNIDGTVVSFTVEEASDKECPICLSATSDPVWLGCCDKIYCKKCIADWTTCGKNCPACCTPIQKKLYHELLPNIKTKRSRIPTNRYTPIY